LFQKTKQTQKIVAVIFIGGGTRERKKSLMNL
jgi:hypothetical protein